MMEIYGPKPGNIFVQPDQAGAEALVVAYLCPPGQFRSLFLNGIKPHTLMQLISMNNLGELIGVLMILQTSLPLIYL